jgi:hypothetical protein
MNISILAKTEKIDHFISEFSNFHYSLEKKEIVIPKPARMKFKMNSNTFEIHLIAN